MAFGMFWSALEPLRAAGKLGHLLFQFPPYFTARPSNLDYIAELKQRMPVRRSRSSFATIAGSLGAQRAETIRFLERHGLTFVSIDTPPATVESVFAVTGSEAYVRFHGRNRENWYKREAAPPNVSSISMRKPNWRRGPSG